MVCECHHNSFEMRDISNPTDMPEVERLQLDTDVVVIGNGPAGISLSAFLSGWHPSYNNAQPHPDETIQERLDEAGGKSLIDHDLSWFQDQCAERINPSVGAFAALYDTLVRPPVDEKHQFLPDGSHTSCLKWHRLPHRIVPHIVLGDGEIGGSWNYYDDEMVTVSMAHWMDLPGYPLAAWMGGKPMDRQPAAIVRQYFRAYAERMDIEPNFRTYTRVTNVMNFCHEPTGERYWQVSGISRGLYFVLNCRKVVLACGRSRPRTLEVAGETTSQRILYDISSMKHILSANKTAENYGDEEEEAISSMSSSVYSDCSSDGGEQIESERQEKQVIVVGDGISAADAVLHCLAHSIPILQLVRRNDKQIRNVMISRLSASVYPEYARVFRLMTRRESDPNYRCLTSSQITSIDNDLQTATVQTPHGTIMEPFQCIVACVGRRSQLDMLTQNYEFMSNYQSNEDDTMFAIGSLAGDHFVRYLIGGALQVAQTLIRRSEQFGQEALRNEDSSNTNIHQIDIGPVFEKMGKQMCIIQFINEMEGCLYCSAAPPILKARKRHSNDRKKAGESIEARDKRFYWEQLYQVCVRLFQQSTRYVCRPCAVRSMRLPYTLE